MKGEPVKIAPFGVEIWMNDHETTCRYNLAETCVESLTVDELLALSGSTDSLLDQLRPMKLTYGPIEGSLRLRTAITGLYGNLDPGNVIVTHGAIGANSLVHLALVERGDRVVSVVPAYQQHYSIPAAIGADVEILRLREQDEWLPDLAELERLAVPGTKLICFTNPSNPTGSLMDEAYLSKVVEIARGVDAYVLCDEVYRGTNEADPGITASIVDLYGKGISTASMSKSFSLAGLRLGWVAGPPEVIEAISIHRDYTTISVGMIDDLLASLALENKDTILSRSREITRSHRAIVDDWLAGEPRVSWVRPKSGTTSLLRYDLDLPSRDFCVALLEETGVLLTPGSAMDMEGYLRLGYAGNRDELLTGLPLISAFLDRH